MQSERRLVSNVGSKSHFIRDCPLRKQDAKVLQGKYTNQRTDTNTNSAPDKAMEPLTRLFTDLVEQLRLLTPLGHNPHNGHPKYKENGQYSHKWAAFPSSHRQHGTTGHHRHSNAHRDHINDHRHKTDHRQKGHHWDSMNTVGHNRKHVKSGSKCDSECSVASEFKEHLDEEAAPTPDSPKN